MSNNPTTQGHPGKSWVKLLFLSFVLIIFLLPLGCQKNHCKEFEPLICQGLTPEKCELRKTEYKEIKARLEGMPRQIWCKFMIKNGAASLGKVKRQKAIHE